MYPSSYVIHKSELMVVDWLTVKCPITATFHSLSVYIGGAYAGAGAQKWLEDPKYPWVVFVNHRMKGAYDTRSGAVEHVASLACLDKSAVLAFTSGQSTKKVITDPTMGIFE